MSNQIKLTEKQLEYIYNDIRKTFKNDVEYINEWHQPTNDKFDTEVDKPQWFF